MPEKIEADAVPSGRSDYSQHSYDYLTGSAQFFLPNGSSSVFPRPLSSLVLMVLVVVFVESFIEIALVSYLPLSIGYHILVDSGMMIFLLLPVFYHFIYSPYKRHHEYHKAAQAQVHYLSRQLINISENERKLLSQNLHDDFGQVLTAMQFGVETIKSSCLADDVEKKECLDQAEKLSQQISDLGDYVRNVSTGLHPPMLEELGLEATLKSHLEEFSRQYVGIKVSMRFPGNEKRLPNEIELAVFRVCQESLNNIAKHANAKNVELNLELQGNILNLSIDDDGEGFDLKELRAMGGNKSGIGLLGVRERVGALGGRLCIDSSPGKGTSIHIKMPIMLRRRKNEPYTGIDS